MPYFYSPKQYLDSVEKITRFTDKSGHKLGEEFQWAYFPYISVYPTVDQAAEIAAKILGEQYLYGGNFLDIVRRYCILGSTEHCVRRLQEYVDNGVKYIIFSPTCPREDRSRQIEIIIKEIVPSLKAKADST